MSTACDQGLVTLTCSYDSICHMRSYKRIDALIHSEGELVMLRAQEVCHLPCGQQVWRALNSNAESVQSMLCIKGILGLLHVPASMCKLGQNQLPSKTQ